MILKKEKEYNIIAQEASSKESGKMGFKCDRKIRHINSIQKLLFKNK